MAQPIKTAPDRFTIFANNPENEFDPTLAALANGLFMIGFTRDSAGDLSTAQGLHESSGGGSGNFIANNAAVDEQHASISGFGSGAMTAFAWTEKNDSTGSSTSMRASQPRGRVSEARGASAPTYCRASWSTPAR